MIDEKALERLSKACRVWDGKSGVEDTTPGLIELCREWVRSEDTVVEIGCFAGVSTSVFARFARFVVGVDPWGDNADEYGELPVERLKEAEVAFDAMCEAHWNVVKMKGRSADVAKLLPDRKADLIYIDGDHSERGFKTDVEVWRPKLKPGGLLAGHDHGLVSRWFADVGIGEVKVYPDSSWVELPR